MKHTLASLVARQQPCRVPYVHICPKLAGADRGAVSNDEFCNPISFVLISGFVVPRHGIQQPNDAICTGAVANSREFLLISLSHSVPHNPSPVPWPASPNASTLCSYPIDKKAATAAR